LVCTYFVALGTSGVVTELTQRLRLNPRRSVLVKGGQADYGRIRNLVFPSEVNSILFCFFSLAKALLKANTLLFG